jgi:hypothetical protein
MDFDDTTRQKINAIKLHTDPLTQAQLVVELIREHPIRNTDLAKELEIKPSYLSHLVRVMKLPEMVMDGYWNKQITFTHLILISRLRKPEEIIGLYEEILQKSLNVSATERPGSGGGEEATQPLATTLTPARLYPLVRRPAGLLSLASHRPSSCQE